MEFNVWFLLQDLGILAALLLIGTFIRAKVKLFQKLLLPAALIGGFIGLALGKGGLNVLPFSNQLPKYAGVMIAIVFAAAPIGDKSTGNTKKKGIGGFFYQNTGILVLQYAAGMLLALGVLNKIWPKLHDSFGLVLATGFYGGHGTAAAIGGIFNDQGYAEFMDLGYTSATIGLVGGILIGVFLINWGTRKGHTNYVSSPEELPESMKTGLYSKDEQKPAGKITVSNMSIDPLIFHISIPVLAVLFGKLLAGFIKGQISWLKLPVFVLALVFGYIFQIILNKTGADEYVDRSTMQRISGSSTDLLIVSAIASLKLSVVVDNFMPLLITFIFGFVLNIAWFLFVSRYASPYDWFERGIMNFGRSNGVVATGVLLNRVVDPQQNSRGLEDTGLTDLMNRPLAICLQVLPPLFISWGRLGAWQATGLMWIIFIVLTVVAIVAKWWTPGKSQIE